MSNNKYKGTVFFIDDEKRMQDSMKVLLEDEGYRVFTTGSNDEAILIMNDYRNDIDIVIQDGNRPQGQCMGDVDIPSRDVSVAFFLRYIRKILPDIPAAFCTWRNDIEFLKAVESFQNTFYIPKPVEYPCFSALIEACTGNREVLYNSESVDRQISLVQTEFIDASDDLIKYLTINPDYMYNLNPRKFEEVVAKLLERAGFSITLTPGTRDGGKDIYAIHKTDVGHMLILVECKRHNKDNKVGVDVVRSLYGVKMAERANMGVVVTTSFFTRDAYEFKKQVGYDLSLRDYNDLTDWLRAYCNNPDGALNI
ncbi:MAG: restriction endonuclease [Candidatus Zixiibacteriota bacterium]